MKRLRGPLLVAFLVFATIASLPRTVRAEAGVIVARTSPDVMLVWRTNEEIASDSASHPATELLKTRLLARGIAVMLGALPAAAPANAAVTLKLVYFNDGGYDPSYHIETVSGVRPIGEFTTTAGALRTNAKHWEASVLASHIPHALSVRFDPGAFDGL